MVQSRVEIKHWLTGPPSVAEVRPRSCPVCDAASEPASGGLVLHGHGLRERQIRGPLTADGAPVLVVIQARRFSCQACGAIVLVVPQGLASRRLYSRMAIGLALCLWSLLGLSSPSVRARCSPWKVVGSSAAEGWSQLRRWAGAACSIFTTVRPLPSDLAAREAATSVATMLSALGPPRSGPRSIEEEVFAGAALAG